MSATLPSNTSPVGPGEPAVELWAVRVALSSTTTPAWAGTASVTSENGAVVTPVTAYIVTVTLSSAAAASSRTKRGIPESSASPTASVEKFAGTSSHSGTGGGEAETKGAVLL